MPGSEREVRHAEEEGVEFVWLSAPEVVVEGSERDSAGVAGVRAVRTRLGLPDATGRQSPELVEGSGFSLDADMVIEALGFDPEPIPALFGAPELEVTRWGTARIDWKTMMTNLDGVFAAGDIVRGGSLVVWAIRDGRDAAAGIHKHIQARADARAAAE
jgi:glutamate synthase (NADPH/NADH) small chain